MPDAASDSDGSHLPVLAKGKQKTQMKALGECASCLYEAIWDWGAGLPALTANTWLSKGTGDPGRRKRLFARTQSCSAWDLSEFPEVPLSLRTFSSLSINEGARCTFLTHFSACVGVGKAAGIHPWSTRRVSSTHQGRKSPIKHVAR